MENAGAGSYSGRFKCKEGWYTIHCFNAGDGGFNSGYVASINSDDAYIFRVKAGADAVLKKLGKSPITIPKYTAAINSTGGSGSGDSSIDIPVDDHEILTFTVNDPYYKYWTEMYCYGFYSDGASKTLMSRNYSSNNSYGTVNYEFDVSAYKTIRFKIHFGSTAATGTNASFLNIVLE